MISAEESTCSLAHLIWPSYGSDVPLHRQFSSETQILHAPVTSRIFSQGHMMEDRPSEQFDLKQGQIYLETNPLIMGM